MKRSESLWASFRYAFAGLKYAFGTQRNIRVQSVFGILALIAGVLLGLSTSEMALLLLTVAFVIVAEMINTVFETLVDLVTQEFHPLAKIAKDVGAAAVITAAITAVIIGLLLFVPKILVLLNLNPR